jgi:spore germination protein (amino acid permease)
MDKGKYKKLNNYHVIFLINGAMTGLGALYLSRDLSPMGYNQWVMLLIFGIVANIAIIPMIKLGLKYPSNNLFEINEKLLGKLLGKIVNIIIIIYGILIVITVSKGYLTLLQITLLTNREIIIPFFFLLGVMIYIVTGGIKLVARFCIIGFFFTIWIMFTAWWSITTGTTSHIFPLFNFTLKEAAKAFHSGFTSLMGFELIMFYFPYIIKQEKVFKYTTIGIWITIPVYIVGVFSCTVYLSPWQLENIKFPLLTLMKAIEFSFIERLENIIVAFWVFLILSTTVAYLWMTKKGIDVLLGKIKTMHLYVSVFIIAIFPLLPIPIKIEKFLLEELHIYIGYGVILLPVLLLLIHKLRSTGGKLE